LPPGHAGEDFIPQFDTFEIDTFAIPDMEDVQMEVTQTTASFQPFCDFLPVPISTFQFPDKRCIGGSATTLSDGNRLGQAREWELTRTGIDSL
jgi:hypothetical protein